jgi:hypothetical protein
MKKITLSFLALLIAGFAFAQIESPVKWSYTAKRISDKVYEIHMTATLDPKWHIYAQDAGEGPEPTTFNFLKNPLIKLDDKVKEIGKLEKEYDPNFRSELKFYSNRVDFVQRVKLKSSASTILKGTVSYMVCNDKKCLPPKEVPFSVKLSGKS